MVDSRGVVQVDGVTVMIMSSSEYGVRKCTELGDLFRGMLLLLEF